MQSILYLLSLSLLVACGAAQYPASPSDVVVVDSQVDPAVKISFKETNICEKAPDVKSYSGFVHLPATILADIGGYNISTYFIYFEARHNASTAPLAIYLAGGPGESSLYAALDSESGPCYVNPNGTDTINNPWSFNEYANLLYIDQPAMTGFSYSELIEATFDIADGTITPLNQAAVPVVNASFGYGIYSSQDPSKTANNTVLAAKALWYFGEHWLSSFPGYKTESNQISVWGNSYGGYWVPETAVQYSKGLQNLSSEHALSCKNLTIDAIGITNGCVDIQSALFGYPDFAYNNTYGIRFGSEALYEEALHNITKPNGCQDLIEICRASAMIGDPEYTGSNATVNDICMEAVIFCEVNVLTSFPELDQRSPFDIAINTSMLQCPYYLPVSQYLDTASVQAALGVPLNFTQDSNVVTSLFGLGDLSSSSNIPLSASTGDSVRQNGLPNIEYLLANNVKIAFIFGDRDYRCPWTGGIATALAANWTHQVDFADAGYEELQGIVTPVSEGGLPAVVKQYDTFSFSRVLGAGHSVSAYAPETVYRIFERTIKGVDVVTGTQIVGNGYNTTGPRTSWGWRNVLPDSLPSTCMVEGQWTTTNGWSAVVGS